MGKCLKLYALFFIIVMMFGCASSKNKTQTPQASASPAIITAENNELEITVKEDMTSSNYLKKFDKKSSGTVAQKLVSKAHSALGTPYVLGGTTPSGFDCSGLVKWTYNSIGVELPRTAREQSTVGKRINNIEDMRAGDIVAFRHPKRGYHTGIYVGDGKFIHSPRKRTRVRVNSLSDPYFSATLLGARRVYAAPADRFVAEAESRLVEYATKRLNLTADASDVIENEDSGDSEVRKSTRSKKSYYKNSRKTSKKISSRSKSRKSDLRRASKDSRRSLTASSSTKNKSSLNKKSSSRKDKSVSSNRGKKTAERSSRGKNRS